MRQTLLSSCHFCLKCSHTLSYASATSRNLISAAAFFLEKHRQHSCHMLSYALHGEGGEKGGMVTRYNFWFQRLSRILVRMMLQSKFAVGLAAREINGENSWLSKSTVRCSGSVSASLPNFIVTGRRLQTQDTKVAFDGWFLSCCRRPLIILRCIELDSKMD